MSKKTVAKSAFSGPAGSSFAQKKKVGVGNIKHSGNEKNISLVRSSANGGEFSDMNSKSSDNGDGSGGAISIVGVSGGFFFGSAATTSKAKQVKPDMTLSSSFSFPNYDMDKERRFGLIPKIVKTPVEVAKNKSFTLDINFLAVKDNSITAKTQLIRKIFSKVNGFEEATTPLKFEEII
ncbi:hypothetical protein G9A89_001598 [Geosiphon pyriformis]|nr:hypothetical protein G9A89_001598 [Geosiphon pyriformis]